MIATRLISRPVVLLAGVLALSGCEVLEEVGVITLQPATVEMSFRFSNTLTGITREVTSEETLSLDDVLADNQYTREEVVSARVTSARIRITTPFQETLEALSDIEVALQSTQRGPDIVATLTDSPDAKEATMNPSGRAIGAYVEGGPFQGVLSLVGAKDVDEDFLVFVTLTVEIDVEGF
ncbi:MAG: hypothetical protein SH809_00280 [Rhodothermales bacterium]|nr:hypothetical protein [Rhodothermales bacterium]